MRAQTSKSGEAIRFIPEKKKNRVVIHVYYRMEKKTLRKQQNTTPSSLTKTHMEKYIFRLWGEFLFNLKPIGMSYVFIFPGSSLSQ